MQMQVVAQLELQLRRERDRLAAMMRHLHAARDTSHHAAKHPHGERLLDINFTVMKNDNMIFSSGTTAE